MYIQLEPLQHSLGVGKLDGLCSVSCMFILASMLIDRQPFKPYRQPILTTAIKRIRMLITCIRSRSSMQFLCLLPVRPFIYQLVLAAST